MYFNMMPYNFEGTTGKRFSRTSDEAHFSAMLLDKSEFGNVKWRIPPDFNSSAKHMCHCSVRVEDSILTVHEGTVDIE